MKKFFLFSFQFLLSLTLLAQIPAGYYNAAEGKSAAALKTQLAAIISAGYVDKGYDGLYDVYKTSDNLPNGKVWDMYSMKADGTADYYFSHGSNTCGSYNSEGDCYNREHTFCDSWLGAASPQRSDAHHLIPTDGYVNNRRSSYPHGKVGSASWTSSNGSKLGSSDPSTGYSGTVFEPIDEFKGDFARMYFYVATRYESKIAGWVNNGSAGEILAGNSYPAFKAWFYNLMLQWNRQDPVSKKEIDRNNAIALLQKNRNPYIDYPELADYIWGDKKAMAWSATGSSVGLTSPTNGTTLDFGKVAYQQTDTASIYIKGMNLTGDLTIALSGANAAFFTLPVTTVSQANAMAGYKFVINYSAQSVGTHTAVVTISGGGIATATITLTATSTDSFMALAASNITNNGFTANWAESAAATGYSVDVFSYTGSSATISQTLLEEDFASALPSTWTSSGYIGTVDLAGNIRLASGSSNGIITSPALNMSSPTTLNVTAKQYSNDTGAKLTVKVNNDSITSFITSSSNQNFTVNIPAKTAASNLVFSALKGARVYVDYVKLVTQSSVQTPVSVNGYPRLVGNVLSHTVTGLLSDSVYYYTVAPQGNTALKSDAVRVKTTNYGTGFDLPNASKINWVSNADGIVIYEIPENSQVTLTDMLGRKYLQVQASSTLQISKLPRAVYLVQIKNNSGVNTCKIKY